MRTPPRIRVLIWAQGDLVERVTLVKSTSFSYAFRGASSALEARLSSWLALYAEKKPPLLEFSYLLKEVSPFQQRVYAEMRKIAFGAKISYRELGALCGIPRAPRAIGGACKRNPFPLFFPCHRIIRADGSLGGFSPDLALKKELLAFEEL